MTLYCADVKSLSVYETVLSDLQQAVKTHVRVLVNNCYICLVIGGGGRGIN